MRFQCRTRLLMVPGYTPFAWWCAALHLRVETSSSAGDYASTHQCYCMCLRGCKLNLLDWDVDAFFTMCTVLHQRWDCQMLSDPLPLLAVQFIDVLHQPEPRDL